MVVLVSFIPLFLGRPPLRLLCLLLIVPKSCYDVGLNHLSLDLVDQNFVHDLYIWLAMQFQVLQPIEASPEIGVVQRDSLCILCLVELILALSEALGVAEWLIGLVVRAHRFSMQTKHRNRLVSIQLALLWLHFAKPQHV